MKSLTVIVKRTGGILDKLAGVCVFAVMLLIVSNIILRVVFNRPILGTYELVGFLSALGIGLALAECALKDGHIAVDFIFQRFTKKMQVGLDLLLNALTFLFWSVTVWYLVKFAQATMAKGTVSPSAEIPIYPFIYLIAFSLAGFNVVLFYKFTLVLKKILANISLPDLVLKGLKVSDTIKRGVQ